MSTPRDWAVLGKRIAAWTPPQNAFDPAGSWTLRYARHVLVPETDGTIGNGGLSGTLLLEQKTDSEAVQLQVTETVMTGFATPSTVADISCAKDALLTPRRWTLNIRWQAAAPGKALPGELDQVRSGRAEGNELVFKAKREHRLFAPERWTAFWNLFAVVPRLPFESDAALTFDMFDELELHKPGQRLAYLGPHSVTLGEKAVGLHVFEQTGHGVLPWRWWLDEQHRVLLASGGRRAYLLDTGSKGGAA